MPQFYSPPGAAAYPMISGLPGNFTGEFITGSEDFYVTDNFGQTVNQSVTTPLVSITFQSVTWHHLQKIWNHAEYGPGLFTHLIIDEKFSQVIKGIGKVELEPDQFISFTGDSFTSLYDPKLQGTYKSVIIWFSSEFLRDIRYEDKVLFDSLKHIVSGFAEKITGPAFTFTAEMKEMLEEIKAYNYYKPGAKKFFHEKMKKLARLILQESREFKAAKAKYSKSWKKLTAIIAAINSDPFKEISEKIVCKEFTIGSTTLRNGMKWFTGLGLIEYRKTVMFTRVVRMVIFDNMLVKDIFEKAGYKDPSNFCKAFKNMFWCKLTDLKAAGWSPDAIDNYMMSADDKFKYGSMLARYMSGTLGNEGIKEMNKWLIQHEDHLRLFEKLTDDSKSGWAKEWFEALGINADGVEWKDEGGWERPDPHGKRDQKNLKWYLLGTLAMFGLFKLELVYGIDGIMGFIKDFFIWIGIG